MLRSLRLSALALAAGLALQALVSPPVALATTATEAQNPDLSVSVSLPDQATYGESVTATISIANNTRGIQSVSVYGARIDPNGEGPEPTTRTIMLLPGQTLNHKVTYTVDESFVPGTHQVIVTVANRNGESSASAFIEVG